MKILLLQPIIPMEVRWGKFKKGSGFVPPLGLVSIASYLDYKGYNVTICDAQLDEFTEKDLEDYLIAGKYNLIGIPTFTNSITYSFKTAEICKKILPDSTVVFGSVHASIMPVQVLKDCSSVDIAVIGEGEYIMEDIVRSLQYNNFSLSEIKGIAYRRNNGQIITTENRLPIDDLDALPLPAYHLLDMSRYNPHISQYKLLPNFPVVIQRGCAFNCAFCHAHVVHGRKVRFRSVDGVMKELKLLKNKYGAKGIYFQDSTFTINKNYIIELCGKMIKDKLNLVWACNSRVDSVDEKLLKLMKRAGCWMIGYGVESGNQKSLDILNKKTTIMQIEKAIELTHQQGIVSLGSYILAIPGETFADALNTIKFAKKMAHHMCLFFLPIPYPKTELERACRKEGGLRNDVKWIDYSSGDFSNPIYINPKIGKEGMQKLLSIAYRKYYTTPKVILNNFLSINCLADIKRYFRSVKALISMSNDSR
jgi:anaerobic magnesium-protoporphyrin IX monomethyl ester cyclase